MGIGKYTGDQMVQQQRIALVLGATGGIGGEVARRLQSRGWTVKALHRNAKELSGKPSQTDVSWIQGDAMQPVDVEQAARGSSLIVHAVNPPGYRNWAKLVLPMLESTIAAGRSSKARILLPGTIYNYGQDAFPKITETIRRAVGNPNLKVRNFPWWLMTVASPFVPLFKELGEMRYLWHMPIRMDNARLVSVLGAEPHTPLEQAVRATLIDLGCLSE
jgi:nucleoside-diphosphate-sugar epimerase